MEKQEFTIPIDQRYFEDYRAGAVYEFGSIKIEQDEIIRFARRFDPQVFHIDPHAARESVFGRLIASGWHTSSLMMRMLADHFVSKVASLGSPGVDELRWIKPVYPGDILSLRVSVFATRRSRSKPDRGIIRSFVEVLNQDRDVVMSLKAISLMRCREPGPPP